MSPNIDVDSLQVGDAVGHQPSGIWYMNASCYVSTVERMTKTQIILANGRKFNKHGRELKSPVTDVPSHKLIHPDYAREYIAKAKRKSEVFAILKQVEALCTRVRSNSYELSDEQEELFFNLLINFETCEDDQQ